MELLDIEFIQMRIHNFSISTESLATQMMMPVEELEELLNPVSEITLWQAFKLGYLLKVEPSQLLVHGERLFNLPD